MDGYVGNIVRGRKSIFVCFVECGCGSCDFLFCQVLIVSSLSRWVSPGALLSLYILLIPSTLDYWITVVSKKSFDA